VKITCNKNRFLKVSKSQKQLLEFSILAKNKRKSKKKYPKALRIIFFHFSFVFWKNLEFDKLLSRFTDLLDCSARGQNGLIIFEQHFGSPTSVIWESSKRFLAIVP
jgi:hypothetical protein